MLLYKATHYYRKRILPYAAAFFNIATVPAKRHGSKTS